MSHQASRQDPDALAAVAREILESRGAPPGIAREVVDVLIAADRRGVVTHGLTRLPSYVERIERGLLEPAATPHTVTDAGALLLLDARNGFGAVAGMHAARAAAARAREHGTAWVLTRESNHFGIASYYANWLAGEGMAAIVFTNASPAMPATGGHRPVVGTNPIAIAAPGEPAPVSFDVAMTAVARGKIRRAAAEGRPIPDGWALDAGGRPTTDAQAALAGSIVPMAGHKGYGFSVMFDLLCGVVSGGRHTGAVHSATDLRASAGVCFTVIAADIGRVLDRDTYLERLAAFREVVLGSGDAGDAVRLPGDLEYEHEQRVRRDGLSLPADVLEALAALRR